jgi:hypothetical protein
MKLNALISAIQDFNMAEIQTILGTRVPTKYTGASQVIVPSTHPDMSLVPNPNPDACIFLTCIDGCSALGAALDKENHPVVLVVGANYGQRDSYLTPWTLPCSNVIHCTGMYDNTRELLNRLNLNGMDFLLVAFNVYPWITPLPWSDYTVSKVRSWMKPIGFQSPGNSIQRLCSAINPSHVILHGTGAWSTGPFTTIKSGLKASPPTGTEGYSCANLSYPGMKIPNSEW